MITSPREDYAVYHAATLADVRRARGFAGEGRQQCDRLLAGAESVDKPNSAWVKAYVHGVRARCLMDLGEPAGAVREFEEALRWADAWGDPSSHIRVGVLRSGIAAYQAMGRMDDAAAWRMKLPAGEADEGLVGTP